MDAIQDLVHKRQYEKYSFQMTLGARISLMRYWEPDAFDDIAA